ncbi:MAG: glycerol-3-phosphate dehydrogenase/oxidase [Paludibacter sp.]|nr:glycerol-3-phosphate dehydrogenase/oxidase [Paludibacter sp.]
MKRSDYINQLKKNHINQWDFIVIGGGATGLGIAVDAASRGYKTVLLEQSDFSKATSSRSTKLVHGGVRYMQKGDLSLVREALRERGYLRKNAPHLVKDQRFIIGNYLWWEKPFYTIGLTFYDLLAGRLGLGRSLPMTKSSVIKSVPQIEQKGLKGGVVYHDGQFDDARLAISLMQTAIDHGAVAVNYAAVTSLVKETDGKVSGVVVKDLLANEEFTLHGTCIINATGIFVDDIIKMDNKNEAPLVRPSQGVHIVVDKSFLGGDDAIMIPKTSDGRVMFALPWHNRVILGTTDTPVKDFVLEPVALEEEVDFILETAGRYMVKKPQRKDVLSVIAGLRPLAAPKKHADEMKTKEISRSHKLLASDSDLITITGGKWTTYRIMAEETVNLAIRKKGIKFRSCVTKKMKIHGYKKIKDRSNWMYVYGSDRDEIKKLEKENPAYADKLVKDFDFTVSQVIWAVRNEMAMTLDDVLARRVRLLSLDARKSIEIADKVARIMAKELGESEAWIEKQIADYTAIASKYILN